MVAVPRWYNGCDSCCRCSWQHGACEDSWRRQSIGRRSAVPGEQSTAGERVSSADGASCQQHLCSVHTRRLCHGAAASMWLRWARHYVVLHNGLSTGQSMQRSQLSILLLWRPPTNAFTSVLVHLAPNVESAPPTRMKWAKSLQRSWQLRSGQPVVYSYWPSMERRLEITKCCRTEPRSCEQDLARSAAVNSAPPASGLSSCNDCWKTATTRRRLTDRAVTPRWHARSDRARALITTVDAVREAV
jgi:hypothetical protein